ncbi:hypothetical protein GO491_02355 [Flavobacteriaceae bacterium Ap0902]|nr:hypothetical protein [Flavobacteriaceae bacterium Ap0902]
MNRIVGSLVLILVSVQLFGQNIDVSPYTFYGYGDLRMNNGAASYGMGGLGTSYLSTYGTESNFMNPAANRNLRMTNFIFEGTSQFVRSENATDGIDQSTTYLSRVSLGFPVSDKATAGIGFQPYSTVGYEINNINENTNPRSASRFDGDGGLNAFQLLGSYNLTPTLSIGVRADYIFGDINRKELFTVEGAQLITDYNNQNDIDGFKFTGGLSYWKKLKDNKFLSIGGTYGIGSNLSSDQEYTVRTYKVDPANFIEYNIDTLQYSQNREDVKLPANASFGISYGKELKWSVGAQVDWENTSDFSLINQPQELNNRLKAAIGGYYIPQFNSFRSYFARATYRAGAYYEQTPIVINGKELTDYGITFGIGLPVGKVTDPSELNIGVALGQRGTTSDNLIKESYANLKVSFTLNDAWFKRRKYD